MTSKRPSSVPRTFAEQLAAFVARAAVEKWGKMHGLDVATLEADRKAQAQEKQKYMEQDQEHRQFGKKFRADQAARYRRFTTAVGVIRAIYKNQPEIIESLKPFKRPFRGSRAKAPPPLAVPSVPAKPIIS